MLLNVKILRFDMRKTIHRFQVTK